MYRPVIHCNTQTVSQFNAETNRIRQALAAGVPLSMFTVRGWELKNSVYLFGVDRRQRIN